MTPNELEFFRRLQRAMPDTHFFPQVAMSALVTPSASNPKIRLAAFRRISQKRVDYAAYTEQMNLLCVIELDDSTHNAKNDHLRDQVLMSAGIRTVRWQSKKKPSELDIQTRLQQLRNDEKELSR